jgi:hypothetical protein
VAASLVGSRALNLLTTLSINVEWNRRESLEAMTLVEIIPPGDRACHFGHK